ncbi:DUF5134 domain-containing protein [Streptomyces sp. NPDC057743]|uniref:DUF5134 domain-containing protein n=1 Tax=Streptomyces sp. NPDC057743 TaxID=3346236 RepID=UPI0036BDC4AA
MPSWALTSRCSACRCWRSSSRTWPWAPYGGDAEGGWPRDRRDRAALGPYGALRPSGALRVAVGRRSRRDRGGPDRPRTPCRHGPLRAQSADRGRALLVTLPHVLMLGAMAWMGAVMGSSPMSAGRGGGQAMDEMPGMPMAEASGATKTGWVGTGQRPTAAVLAVLLVVVALRWLARAFDVARSAPEVASGFVTRGGAGVRPRLSRGHGLGMAAVFALLM